ncbi:unnamed protein product, partial [Ixodes persulcatus]
PFVQQSRRESQQKAPSSTKSTHSSAYKEASLFLQYLSTSRKEWPILKPWTCRPREKQATTTDITSQCGCWRTRSSSEQSKIYQAAPIFQYLLARSEV